MVMRDAIWINVTAINRPGEEELSDQMVHLLDRVLSYRSLLRDIPHQSTHPGEESVTPFRFQIAL
jgi:hypothetical protein